MVDESQTEVPVIPDTNTYPPAPDPRLEAFRYKPTETTETAKNNDQQIVSSELPPVDETGVVADEKQYHPAPDPKFEVFRHKSEPNAPTPQEENTK